MTRLLLVSLGLIIFAACDKGANPTATTTVSQPPPWSPPASDFPAPPSQTDPVLTRYSSGEEIFAALAHHRVSALDFGLYRMNAELSSDISQRLQKEHLGEPIGGPADPTWPQAPVVQFDYEPPGTPDSPAIIIKVIFPNSAAPASEKSLQQLQAAASKAVAFVRGYFRGPCIPPDDWTSTGPHSGQDHTCGSLALYFDLGTERAAEGVGPHENSVLYKHTRIEASGTLRGNRALSMVTCEGRIVDRDVKCHSSAPTGT
jgi:hypothetical protein